ncbi:DNA-binding transcriptional regulator, Lrp family [Meinhardsimonia xiamenensis]|jgi:DNA-binding Lrp family transcriptional regulator|uniref:siroheme decarboxylase n=1 Tax=Meinhardsimonia xiamenensis TaxID=990712 RepID=A0A1G9DAZ2_9RHOB|nr:Lrp/AsnC family transcriptional regulator [Meinhardsimonia xiamenensis]PRX38064.1 DNA-binding Lrp family transcriptional regulator [Meinhardsimonia xiamenensis]SDK61049.1 DNA-binding transcriptional regulator, Lrp family [Meinhardsimonia xiamenensis]
MPERLDPTDIRLIDANQRGFPVCDRPFAEIGRALGLSEAEVLDRLARLAAEGRISRVGATVAPNTISASTLVAMRVPDGRIDGVAALVAGEPGVNHAYLREHDWNFWFVLTGPDSAYVESRLERLRRDTGLAALDLRLRRAFNVDLGFSLSKTNALPPAPRAPRRELLEPGDRPILQGLTEGLELCPDPWGALAARLGRARAEVMGRVRELGEAGIISRLGIIVRHRSLGWTANAMVVWDMTPEEIDSAGPALAATPGITLCYERRPAPGWPYRLYTMIHAKSRAEALATLERAAEAHGLASVRREVLFSVRCFKQSGALIDAAPHWRAGVAR